MRKKIVLYKIGIQLFTMLAIWSFSMFYFHNAQTSEELARIFFNIGTISITSLSSFSLLFYLRYIQHKKLLHANLFYFIIFFIPVFLSIGQWYDDILISGMRLEEYGWSIDNE